MTLKRKIWAITHRDVGLPRLAFVVSVGALGVFSVFYLVFGAWLGLHDLFAPFGVRIPIWWDLSPEMSSAVVAVGALLLLALTVFCLGELIGRPNSGWFEIQALGERRLGMVDLFLMLLAALLFILKLLSGNVRWPHYLVLFVVEGGFILNGLSGKESPLLSPEPLPCPRPIEEAEGGEEDEDAGRHEPKVAPAPSPDSLVRSYAWKSLLGSFAIRDFPLAREDYLAAQKENLDLLESRGAYEYSDFTGRVVQGMTTDVHRLVLRIAETHEHARNLERLDNLLQFVHDPNFTYSLDESSTGHAEYARFPVETLVDKTGDCECLSILLAALLKLHGYRAALIYSEAHCMAGVEIPGEIELPGVWATDSQGVRYFVCEATGSGWLVGQPATNDPIQKVDPV